jgi:hypothetical protein
MIAIPINSETHGECLFYIDGEDFDKIKDYKWCLSKCKNTLYVATGSYGKNLVRLHRLLMDFPEGFYIDHIDGNTLNNCRSNLRLCTHSQNCMNSSKTNRKTSSKYKGVSFNNNKKKYISQLTYNRKRVIIGQFNNEKDAAIAYNNAAVKHFGEFAKLNKVEV